MARRTMVLLLKLKEACVSEEVFDLAVSRLRERIETRFTIF